MHCLFFDIIVVAVDENLIDATIHSLDNFHFEAGPIKVCCLLVELWVLNKLPLFIKLGGLESLIVVPLSLSFILFVLELLYQILFEIENGDFVPLVEFQQLGPQPHSSDPDEHNAGRDHQMLSVDKFGWVLLEAVELSLARKLESLALEACLELLFALDQPVVGKSDRTEAGAEAHWNGVAVLLLVGAYPVQVVLIALRVERVDKLSDLI